MLKKRLLTAGILIPLIMLIIFKAPPIVVALVAGVFALAAAWEWCGLFGYTTIERAGYLTLLMLTMFVAIRINIKSVMVMALMFWVIAMIMVLSYRPKEEPKTSKWAASFIGLLILVPFWLSMIALASKSPLLLFGLLLIVWAADTGAYFGGKLLGKNKLIVHVSPNKTWEGAFFGLLLALVTAGIIYAVASDQISYAHPYIQGITPLVAWMFTSFIIFVFAIFGDLFESLVKRVQGVKDSGGLLPGHGGVLDRIDSLLSTAPFLIFMLS